MTRFTSARANRWIADIDKQIAMTEKFLNDSLPVMQAAKGGRLSKSMELRKTAKAKLELLREERKQAEVMLAEFK